MLIEDLRSISYGKIYQYPLRTCFASKILTAAIIINLKDIPLTKLGGAVAKSLVISESLNTEKYKSKELTKPSGYNRHVKNKRVNF